MDNTQPMETQDNDKHCPHVCPVSRFAKLDLPLDSAQFFL